MRLYNESRRRVKTLIKQAKRQYEENIAAESKHNAKMFFRYIISKKHIRSGIGPLKNNAGNLVTDDQSIANMLNKYFNSVFNTTSGGNNIDTNVINDNVETINALDGQDATTEPSEK